MNSLEKRLTKGSALYIESFLFNEKDSTVQVRFFPNIESDQVDRMVTFYGVRNFSENRFEDFDETTIQTLIGLDQYLEEEGYLFVICTDEEEFSFLADSEPKVEFI